MSAPARRYESAFLENLSDGERLFLDSMSLGREVRGDLLRAVDAALLRESATLSQLGHSYPNLDANARNYIANVALTAMGQALNDAGVRLVRDG